MIYGIVAIEKNQGIGFNGQMPWPRLPGDMRWFKEQTLDQIIIMGRKTWESIGSKCLPDRINLVLSRNRIEGCHTSSNNPTWLLDYCKIFYPYKKIYIIGGSEIYNIYQNNIETFYITEIDVSYDCDKFFDLNNIQKNFTFVKEHAKFNDPIPYTIKEYKK